MQQPPIHPRDDRAAYEYTIQATEDHHAAPSPTEVGPWGRKSPVWRTGSAPNYKPTPLRWPFIGAVIALLLAAIVLVVVAEQKMPDSDNSAVILGLHPNATQPVRLARAVTNTSAATVEGTTTTVITSLSATLDATTTTSTTQQSSSTPGGDEVGTTLAQSTSSATDQSSAGTTSSASQSGSSTSLSTTTSVSSSRTLDRGGFNAQEAAESTNSSSTTTLSVSSTTTTVSSSTTTASSNTTTVSSSTTTVSSSTRTVSPSTTSTPLSISLPSGARLVPISVSVSTFTTSVTVPVSTVIFTSVFTDVETVPFTSFSTFVTVIVSTFVSLGPTTIHTQFSVNGTAASSPIFTGTLTQTAVGTITSSVTSEVDGVTTRTSIGTITGTSTITGVVIPSVGEVTITYYSTILPDKPSEGGGLAVTQGSEPDKVTSVVVDGGGTVGVVQSQGPVILAVSSDEVKTVVVNQQISTGVERVDGSVVTAVVVLTPSVADQGGIVTTIGATPVTVVNNPDPVTVVTEVNGVQRTIVDTPPPQTVVTMEGGVVSTIAAGQLVTNTVVNTVGGTPVTRVVVTTPAGPPFEPISYTVVGDAGGGTFTTQVIVTTPTEAGQPITLTSVDIVGGTPVTQVVVTTANAAAFQPVTFTITTNVGGTPTVVTVTPAPTTIVETINGTPVTRVSTPPVTSFTTTVGGTLTTQVIVTTPTGTAPITLTMVSTLPDSLRTFTTTFAPTTFLTTISGVLRTITSTPSPSTLISTLPRTTRTFVSTATPTAATTTGANPGPTVVASTRVFRWTEVDIFIGTFLPPLLGVALVIPLRIIDLNAKLYQPFQALTTGRSPGADTLLLQYTGVMAFITPVLTLLQGHPVPFLTTLMVGCASFMVPLATEAVGLKLHGDCYLNTASATCGPQLGVSPAPAHALMGLLGAVVVMLVLVVVLVGRWVTGVYANPWSVAGIASLARSPHVRILQDGERGMKRAVADKHYGLGYCQNAAGREEYGIVLLDEAGRGLHDQGGFPGDSDSEMWDDAAAGGKWDGHSKPLPFMPLRYPWRIAFAVLQLAVLVFIIYYHAYYRGGIHDDGKLWVFLNSNTFGVRFVSAIIGVVIAFCWQSFFLSKFLAVTPMFYRSTNPWGFNRRQHNDSVPHPLPPHPAARMLGPLHPFDQSLFGHLLSGPPPPTLSLRRFARRHPLRVPPRHPLQRALQPRADRHRGNHMRHSQLSLPGFHADRPRRVLLCALPPYASRPSVCGRAAVVCLEEPDVRGL